MGSNSMFMAFIGPAEGREAEFNEWYEGTHMPDCLGIEGLVSARRYRLHRTEIGTAPASYVTIYELAEGADPNEVMDRLNAAVPGMKIAGETIDLASASTHTWTPT
jgi:hypothetical protein